MTVEFHGSSVANCPKYNGNAKYETTKIENKNDDKNYTVITIGLDSNNRKTSETRSIYKNGNLAKEGTDFDNDGKPDCLDSWEYDDNGNITAWFQDFNADGQNDRVSRYLYDINNNLLQYGVDEDMDRLADNMTYLEYDEKGNNTKYSVDLDNNGICDKSTKREYDENNHEINRLIDNEGDGIYDEEYKYYYETGDIKTATDATFYYKDGTTGGYIAIYDNEGNLVSKTMK